MSDAPEAISFLLIDEDRFSRAYLRSSLSRRPGVRILEAESALKGLDVLANTPVDAVVLDLLVSDFDGLGVLELIRTHPVSARVQVLIASTHTAETTVRRAKELGVGDYLVKPFQPAEVERRLSALVQRVERIRRLKASPDGDPQKQRVLVADNDRNFVSFATTALAGHYDVKPAISSLEIVVQVNHWNPDLLLLNPTLRGLRLGYLMERLWTLPAAHGMLIYLLGDQQDLERQGGSCHISGFLPRAFVPGEFCSAVASVLEPDRLNARTALSWFRKLEPEVISAVQQVFGMMTRTEVALVTATLPSPPTLTAALRMPSKKDATALLLEWQGYDPIAVKLAAQMTSLPEEEIDEELKGSGITEVLNVVGGRLLECCRSHDLPLKMGLPQLGSLTPPDQPPVFQWQQHFRWGAQDLFCMTLRCFQDWPEASLSAP